VRSREFGRIVWHPSFDRLGIWYWHTETVENGWSAQVCDDSQASAPKQSTRYTASACCRWWIVTWPAYLQTLAEAKDTALRLTRMQKPASSNAACRVEVPRAL